MSNPQSHPRYIGTTTSGIEVFEGPPDISAKISGNYRHDHERTIQGRALPSEGNAEGSSTQYQDTVVSIRSTGSVEVEVYPLGATGAFYWYQIVDRMDAKSRELCHTCSKSSSAEQTVHFGFDRKSLKIEYEAKNAVWGCPKVHIDRAPPTHIVEKTEEDFANYDEWKNSSVCFGDSAKASDIYCQDCGGTTSMSVYRDAHCAVEVKDL